MRILKISTTILFLYLAVSCSQESPTIEIYRKATYQVQEKFNPDMAVSTAEQSLSNLLYDGLFTVTGHLEIKPVLVDNWTISEDGKTYIFTLKKNVLFHDGVNLTSDDVARSYARIQTTESYMKKFFLMVQRITPIDKYKLTIEIKEAYPPFLALLASPAAKISRPNDKSGYAIGSGRFQFKGVEIKNGIRVAVLARNEKYHQEKPIIKIR